MERTTFKIGTSELLRESLEKMDISNEYVCNYAGVWQVFFSAANNSFYGLKVISKKGFAKKGRYHILTAKTINDILGNKILIER